jgi:CheY-like chemotaxis protein
LATPELFTEPLRILAVDDQPHWLKAIRDLLEQFGYQVASSGDASNALYLAEHSKFDALVLDQLLPEQSGLDVLRELRKIGHRQPAIIISGVRPTDELLEEMTELKAIFLPKSRLSSILDKLQMWVELERNPIKVFISYANQDSHIAMGIYMRLEADGFTPWIDKRNLFAALNWQEQLRDAIKDSDFVISCLSNCAVERPWFKIETQLAIARHDQVGEPFVVPIRFGPCELPVEFVERKLYCINYHEDHDEWWNRVVKTLRSKRL